ncbi:pilus assembly PilX N-terminal domain-containing protein [Lysinibacillus sp. KU-BSD001]|uniref:pilus assembly PilX N-terminal domain-containing protein n=1 Tax=Lysinibacillus sp. KU-BSD001 TaxID=3141328 RepID=UPI0036E3D246
MDKALRNEFGYTALLAIFTVVLISILGISLFTVTTNSMKLSKSEHDDQATYYVAEAGLTVVRHSIENILSTNYNTALSKFHSDSNKDKKGNIKVPFISIYKNEFASNPLPTSINSAQNIFEKTNNNEIPEYQVTITNSFTSTTPIIHTIKIVSNGEIGNHSRKLTQTINVQDTSNTNSGGIQDGQEATDTYYRDFNEIKNGITINGASNKGKIYDFRESIFKMPNAPDTLVIDGSVTANGNIQLIFPGTIVVTGDLTLNGGGSCFAASEGIIIVGSFKKDINNLSTPKYSIGSRADSPNFRSHDISKTCGKSYNFTPPSTTSPIDFENPYEI